MILIFLQHIENEPAIVKVGAELARHFKKRLGVVSAQELPVAALPEGAEAFVCGGLDELGAFCEEVEAAFLLLQMPDNQTKTIQKNLNACRSLRIPYILWKNDFEKLATEKILVPIGFLEEEIEKAQFAAAFGRFFGSEITLLQAKDYGSKAATTTAKMKTLLDKFSLKYDVQLAENDSFKIDKEAVKVAEKDAYGLLLISASREYGLDDIIFGSKERKAVQKSSVPILLVNPRGDLYALCD